MDPTIKDFEAAIAELETIVKKLEEGDLPLEKSLELYERGVQLSRFCHARLEEAERRIEILNERGELQAGAGVADRRRRLAGRDGDSGSTRRVSRRSAAPKSTPPSTASCPRRPLPAVVADAMRYSLMAGGKRLRPILAVCASADAVGGDRARLAMPAACAIEFIHTYSLIHDDLPAMDNDMLRRGRPTLHVVAGEGMAILAGDGLLTEAFALLAREPRDDDPALAARKLRVIGIDRRAAGAVGMVGGQAIDLACGSPDRRDSAGASRRRRHCATMHARRPAR